MNVTVGVADDSSPALVLVVNFKDILATVEPQLPVLELHIVVGVVVRLVLVAQCPAILVENRIVS